MNAGDAGEEEFAAWAQADLLQDLREVPGVLSIDWSPATRGGSFYSRTEPDADLSRVDRMVQAVVDAHPRTFEDPADVTVG